MNGSGDFAEVYLLQIADIEKGDRLASLLHFENLLRRDLGEFASGPRRAIRRRSS
jgi:hypothetical protein